VAPRPEDRFARPLSAAEDTRVDVPEPRYAKTVDGVSIAYQVVGEGDLDFVFVNSPYLSDIELGWEWPFLSSLLRGLASRGRMIWFDRRGTGLSDAVSGEHLPTIEARIDDLRAVMDAVGSERPILIAMEDGAAQCFLFAATYPERTRALVTFNATVRGLWAPDARWAWTEDQWTKEIEGIERGWGTPEYVQNLISWIFPTRSGDTEFARQYGRLLRHALGKADAIAANRMWRDTDVRHVLPLIQAPTLATDHAQIFSVETEESRYVAGRIPGAIFAELERPDLDWAEFFAHFDHFIASLREEEAEFDRMLATVLFTDIVGSTERIATMGDRAWHQLIEDHHAIVRAMIGRYRGKEIETAGDGFFATFDGPARGVRCAGAIIEAVRPLGLELRAGLHTGEVETIGENVRGITVHIGARVGALAGPSEIMVSQTVKDLVAGSGLAFQDAGEHELKGIPERWHLYRVRE
jgi:class 3 adenylate cyclase/pimeloyl-ACP methyl ester carboxylesterase